MPAIIHYATHSDFKRQEIEELLRTQSVNGRLASQFLRFEFSTVKTDEPLDCNLVEMVRYKALKAYGAISAPCVVEHAGLILDGYEGDSYPGGLTQPMWDALGPERFVDSVAWNGDRVTAKAVVGYCDGLKIHIFVGETTGSLTKVPKGNRLFYWDTVFVPDGGGGQTYAEIADGKNGLEEKLKLSQSAKAMKDLFQYIEGCPQDFFYS